jgi:hypothetical protein
MQPIFVHKFFCFFQSWAYFLFLYVHVYFKVTYSPQYEAAHLPLDTFSKTVQVVYSHSGLHNKYFQKHRTECIQCAVSFTEPLNSHCKATQWNCHFMFLCRPASVIPSIYVAIYMKLCLVCKTSCQSDRFCHYTPLHRTSHKSTPSQRGVPPGVFDKRELE